MIRRTFHEQVAEEVDELGLCLARKVPALPDVEALEYLRLGLLLLCGLVCARGGQPKGAEHGGEVAAEILQSAPLVF